MDSHFQFQYLFDNLLSQLKKSDRVLEVSRNFGPQKQLTDMFTYLWNLEDVHNNLVFNNSGITGSKNEEKSEEFRKDGNKYFQKKHLSKALELYNKSIIYSHYPDISKFLASLCVNESVKYKLNELLKTSESRNLSFAYSNRSAVLFELKNYEDCLNDISRALYHGYPPILRPKLLERQAKCYIAQKNQKKAEEILNEGLLALNNLGLDEKNIQNSQQSLKTLLAVCNSNENDTEKCQENTEKCQKNNILSNDLNNTILSTPSLCQVNPEIPSSSDAVALSYAPEKGRFLFANRDIMPGEVLIKEEGFSHITLPEFLHSHCSHCLMRTSTPLPCPCCSNVIFCSETCLSKALNCFHGTECALLSLLLALDLGKNAMLAFRLVTQTSLSELKEKVALCEKVPDDPLRLGFNEQNVYASNDYRTIYHLVTNQEQRTVSDLFKRGTMTVLLIKLLLKTRYFGLCVDDWKEVDNTLFEDILIVGKVLFTHLMNLPCNAHSVTELRVNSKKYQESHVEEVGAGAYGVLSLVNHSCNPSMARTCYGTLVVAKAIQFIPKGTEIADSYGEHYAIRCKEERQNYLRQQYYFVCSCEACTKGWPTYDFLSKEIYFKCPRCSASIVLGTTKCRQCQQTAAKLIHQIAGDEKLKLNALFSTVQNAVSKYDEAYENVIKGVISDETFANIVTVILLTTKYASLPNRITFEAQETLKHCFDRGGSHFFHK